MTNTTNQPLSARSTVELSNSVKMPIIGFGAAEIANREQDQARIVGMALDAGIRLGYNPDYIDF